jgi:hypothetical protein
MRGLRTLMLILLAAVLTVGGPLRALPCHAETAPPPCHEMTAAAADMSGTAHDKARKSKPDALAMSCCAGCLPAAVRDIAPAASPGAAVRIAFAPASRALDGLSPAPDHDPPRFLA